MSPVRKFWIAVGIASLVWAVILSPIIARATSNMVTSSNGMLIGDGVLPTSLQAVGRATGISMSPGLVSLGTTDVTTTVSGILAGDTLLCNLGTSTALSAGVAITTCTATGNNTVVVRFMCAAALGITVTPFTLNVAWFR